MLTWVKRGPRVTVLAAFSAAWLACVAPAKRPAASLVPGPSLRFIGRFDTLDPSRPRFAWSASAVSARIVGATVHVHLKDTGYDELQVAVDGEPVGVLSVNPSREDYEVATGLLEGAHDVVLVKRTEARMGELQFVGFDPKPTGTVGAPVPSRRIELIGDSITAGYGDEGNGVTCTGDAQTFENEYASYGAVASRSLGADHVTVAWAGRTTEEMGRLFERTLPAHADSRWDFARFTPDAVVVNLGTNDFNRGDPGAAAFTRAYVALLRRVRGLYPSAHIVCALGPMLRDSYPPGVHALSKARAYITASIDAVRALGDTNVSFLEFPPQDARNGIGCDYHPSKKTHALMAEQLATALRQRLAW
jgi:lysophospholipase L1-like esterase